MGGSQASKLIQNSKLMDTEAIDNLSYLEDGQFAKIYKGKIISKSISMITRHYWTLSEYLVSQPDVRLPAKPSQDIHLMFYNELLLILT